MKKIIIILFIISFFPGCYSSTIKDPENNFSPKIKTLRIQARKDLNNTFDQMKQSILKGDLLTLYSLYSSSSRINYSIKDLEKDYLIAGESLKTLYINAKILKIGLSYDVTEATLQVQFSDGNTSSLVFLKEEEAWKWQVNPETIDE